MHATGGIDEQNYISDRTLKSSAYLGMVLPGRVLNVELFNTKSLKERRQPPL